MLIVLTSYSYSKLKIPNSMDSVLVYIENVMIHKCDEPFSPSLWLI